MPCPFCLQVGMAAANYELSGLVKHIAQRHPAEGAIVGVIGTVLIAVFGPKIWKAITA